MVSERQGLNLPDSWSGERFNLLRNGRFPSETSEAGSVVNHLKNGALGFTGVFDYHSQLQCDYCWKDLADVSDLAEDGGDSVSRISTLPR
ncbi:hypothetical protein Y1Q_0014464 [Alligator mississippiensis]|uniref:Uncharacterized protein n=1 Tax=Alligator mississippiensis TaxID=8496 RepID=A0A151PDN3_ALLMI|nr:hypothetical protein Y1Q_0014464 [Alligator mississippiensis]